MTVTEHRWTSLHRWAARRVPLLRVVFGAMFTVSAVVNAYLAATHPSVYVPFADQALPFVRDFWVSVVVPHPAQPILGLAAFELGAGLMVLCGDSRYVFVGAVLMTAFHVALMAFGWGSWLWCVPMLVLLAVLLDGLRVSLARTRR